MVVDLCFVAGAVVVGGVGLWKGRVCSGRGVRWDECRRRELVVMELDGGGGGEGRLKVLDGGREDDLAGRIEKAEIAEEMSKSYMEFAMSVILGRALPDVRDGLKPVHRRILFAMYEMHVKHDGPYRKSARVVGEVLGKYHPHGDSSVYDALVRMAQPFSMNIPLIDGHGNFGSVDGDSPAAMRYTECRLSKLSSDALLQDLGSETVDFIPNFDASAEEPLVLPVRLPNLLLSGSQGIAVGMATKIPPYNAVELIEAMLMLIQDPLVTDLDLLEVLPAPDFPTGAEIVGMDGARELFSTGHGRIVVQAKTHFERVKRRGGKDREAIIVTELPYQVNKATLVKSIADLVNGKDVEGIIDLRDESDRDGMRIVVEMNRQAHPEVVLQNLFRKSALRSSFVANIVALDDGKLPERLSVRQCLEKFIVFRKEVVRKRCVYELGKAKTRFHLVEGYIKALFDVEKTIKTIKDSKDVKAALAALMDPARGEQALSKDQADAVMSMQLRRLTHLEVDELRVEHKQLETKIANLELTLEVEAKILKIIKHELQEILTMVSKTHKRRSLIVPALEDGDNDINLIPNGRSVILLTEQGYIKRMPIEQFTVQKRGGRGSFGVKNMREEDHVAHFFTCRDHDTVLIITEDGQAYKLQAYKVPVSSKNSRGALIEKLIPNIGKNSVAKVINVSDFPDDEYLLTVTRSGLVKKTPLSLFSKVKSNGIIAMLIRPGDVLKSATICKSTDSIIMCTKFGRALHAKLDDVQFRPMSRRTMGTIGMRLVKGDEIVDVVVVPDSDGDKVNLLVVLSEGVGKRTVASQLRFQRRAGQGMILSRVKPKETVIAVRPCDDDDQFMIITEQGQVIRANCGAVRLVGRYARGVLLQSTGENDSIIAVDMINKRITEETGEALSFLNAGVDISEKLVTASPVDMDNDMAPTEQEDE